MLIFGAGLFSADGILARVFAKPAKKLRTAWPTTKAGVETPSSAPAVAQ